MARKRYGRRDVKRTLKANQDKLLAYPNVRHLAVGVKVSKKRPTGALAIRVIVSRKLKKLPLAAALPKRMRGVMPDGKTAPYWIPIDVEVGPRSFAALSDGVAGGDRIERVGRGATGLVYTSRSGRSLLLTNAHVVARPGDRPSPVAVRHTSSGEAIGDVHRLLPLHADAVNRADASLVWVYQGIPTYPYRLRGVTAPVVGVGSLDLNAVYEFVDASGHEKQFALPNEVLTPVPVTVNGVDLSFVGFFVLKATAGDVAIPGDSGSLLVRRTASGLIACAVVFAGKDQRVAVFALAPLLRALCDRRASIDDQPEDVNIAF